MQKAKKIFIKSRKNIFGEYIGNNNSLFSGEGFDFNQLREYQDGDDIKKIDWMITAKLNKPYVKEYLEQRQLNIVIANMLSGSTYFGTKSFKIDTIANLNAILSFIAIKNSDNFSTFIYADKLYNFQKPTKKEAFIQKNIENILKFDTLKKEANYKVMVDSLFTMVTKKSIIFIISDFFDEIDLKLLSKKHEVIAIIVRDRFEENLSAIGDVTIIDPSTLKQVDLNIDTDFTNRYNNLVEQRDRLLIKKFKDCGVRFIKIYTDDNPFLKLSKFFK
jgi:uncharacterized protein (DUF58 family)